MDFNFTFEKIIDKNQATKSVKWHYIAQYTIHAMGEQGYEVIDRSMINLHGSMDSHLYYSECLSESDPKDFMDGIDLELGVYQLVFGVVTCGSESWTDCGYEYDA